MKDDFVELNAGEYPLGIGDVPILLSPYAISPKETTYGQMKEFALANELDSSKYRNKEWSEEPEDDTPAVLVNWFDAIRYANWLSDQSGLPSPYTIYGLERQVLTSDVKAYWDNNAWQRVEMDLYKKGYRLPTEAEWEYAASGYEVLCSKQRWAGTNELGSLGVYAWSDDNSRYRIRKIAALMPNVLGLYDMSGNASEWCYDEYNNDPWIIFGSFKNVKDPFWQSPKRPKDMQCVLRGGNWNYPKEVHVFFRDHNPSYISDMTTGFRLVRSL